MIALLERCQEKNIVLNREDNKLILKSAKLPYKGHLFTSEGLKADPAKIIAVEKMPRPGDKAPVRRFLGVANYLSRFVPKLADLAEPLRKIIRQENDFNWTRSCENAFQDMKKAFSKSATLKYFDNKQPVKLQCDASSTGLGAVLLQCEQPVAYPSCRALTKTDCNYCQREKEMLAFIFATN